MDERKELIEYLIDPMLIVGSAVANLEIEEGGEYEKTRH